MTDSQTQDPTTEQDEEVFMYLDGLRESGATNMFGAGSYVQEEFGVDKREAKRLVVAWMKGFGERHNQEGA